MSFIQNYVARQLLFEHHPAYDAAHCIETVQGRVPCGLCRSICPTDVFRQAGPDWDRCISCNLCVAACPSECILMPAADLRRWLTLLKNGRQSVSICCRESGHTADLVVSCIYAIPWEFLCALAIFYHITIFFEGCDVCNLLTGKQLFNNNLSRIRKFLGEDRFQEAIDIAEGPALPEQRGYTRRDVFRLAFSASHKTAAKLLPSEPEQTPQHFLHTVLAKLAASEGMPAFGWKTVFFTDKCSACGICEKICPADAIYRVRDDDDPECFHMAVFPSKCTECGLCEKMCPEKALTPPQLYETAAPQRPLVHSVRCRICEKCGEPLSAADGDSTICMKCAAEDKCSFF